MCAISETPKAIRLQLLQEMKDGRFAGCDRLPRETVLAEDLKISRNQLRDTLAQLEREGFITRRHGVGTLINHHVLQVKNRMDIETEFLDIIRNNGCTPGVACVHAQEGLAVDGIAEKLKVAEGEEVIRISRVCTADGKPVIYCEDVLAKRLIKAAYTPEDLERPIFYFLQKFCGTSAYMDLTQLHAVLADEAVAKALNVPIGTPLLNMEELDYDVDGNPVFYSSQYFVEGLLEQTVLRKKL